MSTEATDSNLPISLPLWQVLLVLPGMPALYIANSLMPWSTGLLQRHDHSLFLHFWTSIVVLHWASVALITILLKRAGKSLFDIGLQLSPLNIAAIFGIPLLVGVALTVLHGTASPSHVPASVVLPATLRERLFWIVASLTAGFCEELIYRGFSIRVLQGRNVRTFFAIGLANLAFYFMHGISAMAWSPFLVIYMGGLLFSALFLWRRSLVPVICLHALIDMSNIGAP